MRALAVTAWILVLVTPGSLKSQTVDDELAITIATVSYYQERVGSRRLGVDPRVLMPPDRRTRSSRWAYERPVAFMARALTATNTTLLRDDRSKCRIEDPAGCRLAGVDSYLAMAQPVIEGDSATVDIHTVQNLDRPKKYAVVGISTARVTLRKTPTGWEVVAFKILGQS